LSKKPGKVGPTPDTSYTFVARAPEAEWLRVDALSALSVRAATHGDLLQPNCVLVAPGGGFRELVYNAEGKQTAEFLNRLGVAAFVLKYRLGPRYHHPIELGVSGGCHARDALRSWPIRGYSDVQSGWTHRAERIAAA